MNIRDLAALRGPLWRAELAAWLHNAGKLHLNFPAYFRGKRDYNYRTVLGQVLARLDTLKPPSAGYSRQTLEASANAFSGLLPVKELRDEPVSLPEPFRDRNYTVADIIEFQDSAWYPDLLPGSSLTHLFQVCHGRASNAEKEALNVEAANWLPPRLATVFGYEKELDVPLWRRLWSEFGRDPAEKWKTFLDRPQFLRAARKAFSGWYADGNWPINDVSLYDIHAAAAAMFKAAVAKCLIEQRCDVSNLRFRALRILVDGRSFYGRAGTIPDLLSRRRLLLTLLDHVRAALEETYPIANEIYRDDSGSCFLIPDLEAERHAELTDIALAAWRQPRPAGDPNGGAAFWQDVQIEIAPQLYESAPDTHGLCAGAAVEQRPGPPLPNVGELLNSAWQRIGPICTVCGLRPVAAHGKARDRDLCDSCEPRREQRSRQWTRDRASTIWLDEVGDIHGRAALIVARFGLEGWLGPEGVASTGKQASFARLSRVWGTCARFWEDWLAEIPAAMTERRPFRLRISGEGLTKLGAYHAYYLNRGPIRMSVVWDREQGNLLTADHLGRVARQAGFRSSEAYRTAAAWIVERLVSGPASLEEATGYGSPNRTAVSAFSVSQALVESPAFTPLIPIEQSPARLFAIVPGAEAMRLAGLMRARYDREMGRVQSRLPLHLGIVWFPLATPIAAVLDCGRRLLKTPAERSPWIVTREEHIPGADADVRLSFHDGASREMDWSVPATLSGTDREDEWYPKFRRGEEWVIAKNLKIGDRVEVQPSTFDYQFLDSAARRFETASPRGRRARLLDDIVTMEHVWETLAGASTQLEYLFTMLTLKSEDWQPINGGAPGDVLTFTWNTLKNLEWENQPTAPQWELLRRAASSGILRDTLEIYLKIVKEGAKEALSV